MTDSALHSFGIGLAHSNANEEIIEVFYPLPISRPDASLLGALGEALQASPDNSFDSSFDNNSVQRMSPAQCAGLADACEEDHPRLAAALRQLAELGDGNHRRRLIACVLARDEAPASIAEAFLKLHLLSHRLAKPNSLNLDGMFALLKNLAWTNEGPVELGDLPARQLQARLTGAVLDVQSVDKFPKMTNYVVPPGVRIADTARVRLGAYVGQGSTVMHEGFINFNAGTLGAAMVEGRISAGVVVGENSDLGGGCSTMGTLSGGGSEVISVGSNCLIGANAGIGISLADGCIVEAGLYVTAGTKVRLLDDNGELQRSCKAAELMTLSNHLFRRNSVSGAVECVPLRQRASLNEALHSHN